jgi:hypothetical protein
LGLAQGLSVPLLRVLSQNGGNQLIAALANLRDDPLDGDIVAETLERPTPGLHVCGVGVHQRPVEVEDDTSDAHEAT